MHTLSVFDTFILSFYLIGITVLGSLMIRRIKTRSEFFMPRRFGKLMMTTFAFGTGTASDQAVSVAAETFRQGISGIWWQWLWLPATPFYWLIAPIMRRLRAITTADVYALRYDRSVSLLFAVVGIIGLSVKIGLILKGAGKLVEAATGNLIPAFHAMVIMTFLFVLYGTAGGLSAAIITDFVQGILTVIFSFMLLPPVLSAVGGLEGIKNTLKDPALFSLVVPGEIGVFFVVMYAIQALMGIVAQPFIMGVCSAGRTELDGRVGFMTGNIIKRVCTAAWAITALGALAWYTQQGIEGNAIEPDHVYGNMARIFLPKIAPGLLGLFLASLMASVMSSCDAMMVSSSALVTENIYRPLFPNRPDRHYVFVGRVASILVIAGGILFAWYIPDVVSALKVWFKIAPMMGIAFWLGLFWRRATAAGAWAVTITGFATWFLLTRSFFIKLLAACPFAQSIGMIHGLPQGKPKLYEPWLILIYMVAALFAGIFVSLFTKKVSEEKLNRFYALIRTPVKAGETVPEPCALPPGAHPQKKVLRLESLNIQIPYPSKVSVIGFLAGWAGVAALVYAFCALMA